MHNHFYKRGYDDETGAVLRKLYEDGIIKSANEFEEVLADVLFNCKKI